MIRIHLPNTVYYRNQAYDNIYLFVLLVLRYLCDTRYFFN